MPAHTYGDPKHWYDRAAEIRVLADKVANVEARRVMFKLADEYDRLGDRAADQLVQHAKQSTPTSIGFARP